MQALFDDAQNMAPDHSRWMRQIAKEAAPTTSWLGTLVQPSVRTTSLSSCVFLPIIRVDNHVVKSTEDGQRLTVKSGAFLLDLNVEKRFRLLTQKAGAAHLRVANGIARDPVWVRPDPDVAPVCTASQCNTCELWLPCRNTHYMRTGTLRRIDLSTFHFTKRGRYPKTKTWKAPGEEITGLGMLLGPTSVDISSEMVFRFIPQFIKDDT